MAGEIHAHDPAMVLELLAEQPPAKLTDCVHPPAAPQTYKCVECGRQFTQMCNLKQHCRTHNNERPYTCLVCKKAFKQMNHLQTHIRAIHTGEKPYMCPVETCTKSFHQQGNLNEHIKRCHCGKEKRTEVKKMALCHKCGRLYKDIKSLKGHIFKTSGNCNDEKGSVRGWNEEGEEGPSEVAAVEVLSPNGTLISDMTIGLHYDTSMQASVSSPCLQYPNPVVKRGPKPGGTWSKLSTTTPTNFPLTPKSVQMESCFDGDLPKTPLLTPIAMAFTPVSINTTPILRTPTPSDALDSHADWLQIAHIQTQQPNFFDSN